LAAFVVTNKIKKRHNKWYTHYIALFV